MLKEEKNIGRKEKHKYSPPTDVVRWNSYTLNVNNAVLRESHNFLLYLDQVRRSNWYTTPLAGFLFDWGQFSHMFSFASKNTWLYQL